MNILVIGAHPDDIAISCSGTVLKYIANGESVYLCTISNGCYGHTEIEPERLAGIRIAEDRAMADILKAKAYYNLNINDQFVDSNNIEQVNLLADVITEAKPDLIITHAPDDYHRDHQETYKLVFRASCAASLVFWSNSNTAPMCPIYLMDSFALKGFEPTEYVDITPYIDNKIKAILCHESQDKWMREHDGLALDEFVEKCSAVRGYQCGVKYAEGFKPDMNYGRMSTKRLLP
ncbi:MAG: PIG-L family deacetylase [Acutalibacteraceae bacterium]|nr:PIG-L family deacetylase [Acutalibacteraceae bacterium]